MEQVIIKTKDLDLAAAYFPAENPRAVVQIVHGMVEHKERYYDFIEYLNGQGFTVIISDNRGHGASVNDEYPLGHTGSPLVMAADQYAVTSYVRERNPGLPLYMFAHSMGSLIAREYLTCHDEEIEKLVLSGTVAYIPAATLGVVIAKMKKPRGYSKLLWALSNGVSFKRDLSWLSYNEENIKAYASDPLCRFRFTNLSNGTLFTLVQDLKKINRYQCKNPGLKILSLSGKDDRTTCGTKSLVRTLDFLKKVGYTVDFKEYDGMRHEILKEKDFMTVYEDVREFLWT